MACFRQIQLLRTTLILLSVSALLLCLFVCLSVYLCLCVSPYLSFFSPPPPLSLSSPSPSIYLFYFYAYLPPFLFKRVVYNKIAVRYGIVTHTSNNVSKQNEQGIRNVSMIFKKKRDRFASIWSEFYAGLPK